MFKAKAKLPGIPEVVKMSCDGDYRWTVSHPEFRNTLAAAGLISDDPWWPPGNWDVRTRFVRLMDFFGGEILEFEITPGPSEIPEPPPPGALV